MKTDLNCIEMDWFQFNYSPLNASIPSASVLKITAECTESLVEGDSSNSRVPLWIGHDSLKKESYLKLQR